jgi:NAD/NADP transhydrogenase beta subunit
MTRFRETSVGRIHRAVRVFSIGVLTASTAAVIASQPWHADRPQRFVVLSLILVVVLAVQVGAAVALTSRAARLAPVTLLAGSALAVVATAAWILPRLWAPGLPVSGTGSLLTLELGALVAAALVGWRTRDLVQAVIAGLWAAAVGSFLTFTGALLAFSYIASSVPNTQGRAMLPSATAAQRLVQNRLEAPDGYLVVLFVSLLIAGFVCVTVPMARRSAPARHHLA